MKHCIKMQLNRYHYHCNRHQQLGLNRYHLRAFIALFSRDLFLQNYFGTVESVINEWWLIIYPVPEKCI
jgi:hypothetical protein